MLDARRLRRSTARAGLCETAEVLGAEATGISLEVWALRIFGGSVREVLATDPAYVATREYVFALPLDVMGDLARKLTEVYEQQSGTSL